jgi:hypothetical protein
LVSPIAAVSEPTAWLRAKIGTRRRSPMID